MTATALHSSAPNRPGCGRPKAPYGALTPAAWTGRPPLLIAAGVGITTMGALLDEFAW